MPATPPLCAASLAQSRAGATELFLHLYFRRAVQRAALCSLVSTVACAETHTEERPADDDANDAVDVQADAGSRDATGPDAAASVAHDAALRPLQDGEVFDAFIHIPPPFVPSVDAGRSIFEIWEDPSVSAIPNDAGANGGGWRTPECGDAEVRVLPYDLSRLTPSVDYVALRETSATHHRVVAESGSACRSARDPSACNNALAAAGRSLLPANAVCAISFCQIVTYAVTTQGDEVKVWHSAEELRVLFGTLDSPGELFARLAAVGGAPQVSCDAKASAYRVVPAGFEVRTFEQIGTCPPDYRQGYVTRSITAEGVVSVLAEEVLTVSSGCPIAGRRPAGLQLRGERARSVLADYFARMSALEAASVPAFQILERELSALGAPDELLAQVRAAIADERDHTVRTARLAQRFGAQPEQPAVEAQPLRAAFALAMENAVEGCVRESFGALLATYQATRARDPEVRDTMARIALDEHATPRWPSRSTPGSCRSSTPDRSMPWRARAKPRCVRCARN